MMNDGSPSVNGALPPPPWSLMRGSSVFLDFDGTLVGIAGAPEAVVVDAALPDLLLRLDTKLEGRVVLLSGRSLAQLDTLLDCGPLKLGGSHGLERRPAAMPGALPPIWPDWLDNELAALTACFPGVLAERKSFGVALHFRQQPEAAEACAALAGRVAEAIGGTVQPGKMVYEVKPKEADKGEALRSFMAEPEFKGSRPLMFGDDLTDEPAFAAAAALGGAGILVGQPRRAGARYGLPDPAAVLAWLDAGMARL